MKQNDLPQRWKNRIATYLKETGSRFNSFGADSFQHNLKIEFEDGSNSFFKYAFYWVDNENKEIAVFTEHCGYHIFQLLAVKLETIDRKNGKIIKTEDFRI
ncbi:MAG: hypothetical protein K1X72_15680 [Pyrinomonadaceae bacterium]|nr:hypothetical protein [Pyrinomonadaceae bacterium]